MNSESTSSAARQIALGNQQAMQIGRDLNLSVFLERNDTLQLEIFPQSERSIAKEAWAHNRTAGRAEEVLRQGGFAVISGRSGNGRHSSALRALCGLDELELYRLYADWEEGESLDAGRLPADIPRTGLLLDLTAREVSADTAQKLVSYSEQLKRVGSALAVIVDVGAWPNLPYATSYLVQAEPPDLEEVVVQHLAYMNKHEQVDWVRGTDRNGFRKPKEGLFSSIISDLAAPREAVRLAELIAKHEDRDEAAAKVPDQFKRWEDTLRCWWNDGQGDPQKRALILTVAMLEGAQVDTIYHAWRMLLGKNPELESNETILAGMGFRPRLDGIDAKVEDKAVRFKGRPGLDVAVIRHVWHEWDQLHESILEWVKNITTKDKKIAGSHVERIGRLFLGLAGGDDFDPLMKLLPNWFEEYPRESASVLTEAAADRAIGADIRTQLRIWAQRGGAASTVVANVCGGEFAKKYPHQALTRLKWVLRSDIQGINSPVVAGQAALRSIAKDPRQRLRVIATLGKWAKESPERLEASRGLLGLIGKPDEDSSLLRDIIEDAARSEAIAEIVTVVWTQALTKPEISDEVYDALVVWTGHAHAARIPKEAAMALLRNAIREHTPTDAAARFLYGDGEGNDVLSWARQEISMPGTCIHANCPVCGERTLPSAVDRSSDEGAVEH